MKKNKHGKTAENCVKSWEKLADFKKNNGVSPTLRNTQRL